MAMQMERVAGQAALRRRLRQAGLARVRQFSWERASSSTLAVYERAWNLAAGLTVAHGSTAYPGGVRFDTRLGSESGG
jgi:hypothetical protein